MGRQRENSEILLTPAEHRSRTKKMAGVPHWGKYSGEESESGDYYLGTRHLQLSLHGTESHLLWASGKFLL